MTADVGLFSSVMAGNLLWAHLLRKDATTTDSPPQIPVAPQDKTSTSMRMLIHDTQVNLEKFSSRLDGLLQRVDDCRAQVINANKLLDVERDKVLSEILEIAHRCQSDMKAHVGTPAQASVLDLVQVSQLSTEKSVQALERRIDALQVLLQTHIHAMQSIQDQQNALLGAVLPLMPIVHGISPQVDQIKATLSDMVASAVSTMTNSVESIRSTLVAEFAHAHGRAGSSTRAGPSRKSMSSSRRRRSDDSVLGPQEINIPVSSPLDNRDHRKSHPNIRRARVERVTHRAGGAQLPRKLSRLVVPLTNLGDQPPRLQTPQTPRRPLADLLLIPDSNPSRIHQHITSHINSASRGYIRPFQHVLAPGGSSTEAPPMSGPPLQDSRITRCSAGLHDMPMAVDKFVMGVPNAAGPSDQDFLSKAIKIEEILEPKLTGVFSVHSSPLSSPPSSLPPLARHDPHQTDSIVPHSKQQDNIPDASQVEFVQIPLPSSGPLSCNLDTSSPKSMSLRDRRAQISRIGRTEMRRFIPLVPWSDEEE